MDGQLSELRLESDERAKEQARQMQLIHTKIGVRLHAQMDLATAASPHSSDVVGQRPTNYVRSAHAGAAHGRTLAGLPPLTSRAQAVRGLYLGRAIDKLKLSSKA